MALKDIPQAFDVDSEEDLRLAVVKYFHELGFGLDEIKTETRFAIQLGHNTLVVGGQGTSHRDQVTGRSDILLARHGKPLAIVETKAPGHALNEKDALQALSYARLLREMAPYAIVTNGKDTRVYDTFASTLAVLENPCESVWSNKGQQLPSIREDLRFDAAQTLIGLNPQTLRLFCQKQVAQALEDIKGTPHEARQYIPDVYVPRQGIEDSFYTWLATDIPCFAVVAESGLGKTNFMCATAEKLIAEHFILFYSAGNLVDDLRSAICNDFVWEFHREKGLAYIVDRFTTIAHEHNQKFVIFVDGLDEFPQSQKKLKNELLDLVHRLRKSPIRLCLSCKAFDWENFVIDNRRTFNKLAKSTYSFTQVDNRAQAITSPSHYDVGIWLQEYTDEELDNTFTKYKEVFSLQGTLQGTARSECHVPLILRLLADVWSGRKREIPSEVSQREVFDSYWDLQLSKIQNTLPAERWLSALAKLSVESGKRQIDRSSLLAQLSDIDAQDETYQDLVRCGFIRIKYDGQGYQKMTFGLEKMRSYVYTLRVQEWPKQTPKDIAKKICELLENPLGVEAVEFYLQTIDRGETRLLIDIALHDIRCFIRLIDFLNKKISVFEQLSDDEQQGSILSHLEQYALVYSEISRQYFPELCEKIEPYTKDVVGLWVSDNLSTHQLRTRTTAYPQPVVIVPNDLAIALQEQKVSPEFYDELRPGGNIHIELGMSTLIDQLPQKMAWQRVLSQVTSIFHNRCLDETTSPDILQERSCKILLEEPNIWAGGIEVTGKYWQIFGCKTIQDIQSITIEKLEQCARDQIQQYTNQFVGMMQQHKAEILSGAEPAWARWYLHNIRRLNRLYYFLKWLSPQRNHLELPSFTSHDLFGYLRTGDLAETVSIVEQLLPAIFRAYSSLVQQNFSQFADRLVFFKFSDASMLVEVTHLPSYPSHRNDFLRIAYAVLPSTKLPKKYMVYTCEEKDSLAHTQFVQKTLQGWTVHTSGMQGARFGQAPLSHCVDNVQVKEQNAFFCFTRFPSHHPILDQAYQLLGNEVQYLLEGESRDWHKVATGQIDNEQLDEWISRQSSNLDLDAQKGL